MATEKQEVQYNADGMPVWKNEDGTLNTFCKKEHFLAKVPADDKAKKVAHKKEFFLFMYNCKLAKVAEFQARIEGLNEQAEEYKEQYENAGREKSPKEIAEAKLLKLQKQQEALQKQLAEMDTE